MAGFFNAPQMFIENAAQIIRDTCNSLAIDGISYKELYGAELHVVNRWKDFRIGHI